MIVNDSARFAGSFWMISLYMQILVTVHSLLERIMIYGIPFSLFLILFPSSFACDIFFFSFPLSYFSFPFFPGSMDGWLDG